MKHWFSSPLTGKKKKGLMVIVVALIVAIAFMLRLSNVGHLLSWDEAWNVNSIMDAATGNTDPSSTFFPNLLRHPPAYTGIGLVYASVTGADRFHLATALEIISILFSLGLICLVFFCGREWFGDIAGLAASFVFALMPAALVYDTWIKQESMTLLFGLLFLFLFFKRKYLLSGVFLGAAMLTKEIAVFLIFALGLFVLIIRRWREIKGLVISIGIAFLMSAWWYLFVSTTKGMFLDFFLGRHPSAVVWRKPWYYYFTRIPQDLGWGISVLVLLGLIFLFRKLRVEKESGADQDGFTKGEYGLFLFLWLVAVYAPLSLSYGKPPWMVYSALPSFALLAGWGASSILDFLKSKQKRALMIFSGLILCALVIAPSVLVSYGSFVRRADVMYKVSVASKKAAEYVNKNSQVGAKVLMRLNDLTPTFAFYLESYKPGCMALLPLEGKHPEDLRGHSLFLLDNNAQVEDVFSYARMTSSQFLLSRRNSTLGRELSKHLTPKKFGALLIFDFRNLVPGTKLRFFNI